MIQPKPIQADRPTPVNSQSPSARVEDSTSSIEDMALEVVLSHSTLQGDDSQSLQSLASINKSLRQIYRDTKTSMTLRGDSLSGEIKHYPRLVRVKITAPLVNDRLQHLGALRSIRHVDLSGCPQLDEAGLAHLRRLPQLTSLNLGYCMHLWRTAPQIVKDFTTLTSLNLHMLLETNDASLAHLTSLSRLTSLTLSECRLITNDGLKHLATFSQLSTLNLNGCPLIREEGLLHLRALPQLQSLTLGTTCKLTEAGVEHLVKLPHLRSLGLGLRFLVIDETKDLIRRRMPQVALV